jgi:hypothetical protein
MPLWLIYEILPGTPERRGAKNRKQFIVRAYLNVLKELLSVKPSIRTMLIYNQVVSNSRLVTM